MASLNLLYKDSIDVIDGISIRIPSIGEIIDFGIDDYYAMVYLLTAMPIDMMVVLDDQGIDFSKITDYDLFLQCWPALVESNTVLIFGDLDLSKFYPAMNEETGDIVLIDPENDVVIDRRVQQKIAVTLRTLHHLEKDRRKPANEEARVYMLERARTKAKRKGRTSKNSDLERLIVAMVNTEQFKYDFKTVRDLTIYQFNECVQQVLHKLDYEHLWHGVYSGNVDVKALKQDQLNLLRKD